ncbi:MAG: superoxide dismutase family protein [Planctomycetota bacterium]|nr:superoxide dismutase family protein [Planctomycetota bacterium]
MKTAATPIRSGRMICTLGAALALALATGCASQHGGHGSHGDMTCGDDCPEMKAMMKLTDAVAVVRPTAGNTLSGTVRFTAAGHGQVKVVAHVEGLAPSSVHGFHIHELGDVTGADGMTTGGHFDPAGTGHHGMPADAVRHGGDMGNLTANAQGVADLEVTISGVSIGMASNGILGRAVIVHAKADDAGQPTGNAGGRIGTGVIGLAKAPAPAAK